MNAILLQLAEVLTLLAASPLGRTLTERQRAGLRKVADDLRKLVQP